MNENLPQNSLDLSESGDAHQAPQAASPWCTPPPSVPPAASHTGPVEGPKPYPSSPHPSSPYPHTPYTGPGPDQTERNWAVAANLSGFVAAWIALGFLGPLVVLLAAGSTSPFVRRHSVEALNFNLSVLIYVAVSVLLMFVLIGFLALPLVGLVYLVASIQGAMAASRGQDYRYPLTIRFIS